MWHLACQDTEFCLDLDSSCHSATAEWQLAGIGSAALLPRAKLEEYRDDQSQWGATGLSSWGVSPGQRQHICLSVTPWWWGVLCLQQVNCFPLCEVLHIASAGPQRDRGVGSGMAAEITGFAECRDLKLGPLLDPQPALVIKCLTAGQQCGQVNPPM